jgi:hypothetical protein
MSLKERLKKGLARLGKAVSTGVGAMSKKDPVAESKKQAEKKKKLRAGMLKATGNTKESARAINRRVEEGAKRRERDEVNAEVNRRVKKMKQERIEQIKRTGRG